MIGNISKILDNLKKELKIAKQASMSPFNTKQIPSIKNLKAEKYSKATIELHGMTIHIENPRLSNRFGVDSEGNKWENTILQHYGEIKDTMGADGDPLDVFLGYGCYDENPGIYIVNQYYENKFDEHKIMFGFANDVIAKNAYLEQYRPNWDGFHSIAKMELSEFKEWIKNGDTSTPVK